MQQMSQLTGPGLSVAEVSWSWEAGWGRLACISGGSRTSGRHLCPHSPSGLSSEALKPPLWAPGRRPGTTPARPGLGKCSVTVSASCLLQVPRALFCSIAANPEISPGCATIKRRCQWPTVIHERALPAAMSRGLGCRWRLRQSSKFPGAVFLHWTAPRASRARGIWRAEVD